MPTGDAIHPPSTRRTPWLAYAAALAVVGVALLAIGVGSVRAATYGVAIRDFAYVPATLTVTAGDTVTWTNEDAVAHTATSMTGAFDTGSLAQGESGSITFTTPGTYSYFCEPHPSMTGTIVVQAAPAPTQAPPAATAAPATGGGGQGLPDVATELPQPDWAGVAIVIGALLVVAAIGLAVLARRRAT